MVTGLKFSSKGNYFFSLKKNLNTMMDKQFDMSVKVCVYLEYTYMRL